MNCFICFNLNFNAAILEKELLKLKNTITGELGTTVQQMTMEMIDSLYSKRIRNSLGKLLSPRQDLTLKQLKIYYEENGYDLNEKFLNNLEL